MGSAPDRPVITVWWCDTCGYWRQEKTSGIHQTGNPENWRGKLIRHELRERTFVAADEEGA